MDAANRDGTARTWIGAGLLILGLTLLFTVLGVDQARQALDPSLVDRETYLAAIGLGLNPEEAQNLTGLTAIVILLVCAVTLAEGLGVLARRQGPRHAALGTFAAFTIVTIPLAIVGLFSQDPSRSVLVGLLIGVADALVVYLLLHPRTVLTFDRAAKVRQRRKDRQQA